MPADRDAALHATRHLVTVTHQRVRTWKFDGNQALNQVMAAAGLLRSTELLDEAAELCARERTVGVNVLVRAAFEYWLIGTYALFGGADALVAVETERVRNERNIAERNELDVDTHAYLQQQVVRLDSARNVMLDGREVAALKFDQIAAQLGPLITAHTGEPADVSIIYNLLYRSHSTFDAHPPKTMGSLIRENSDGTLKVVPPALWNEPAIAAATMSLYVGVLGRWIEEQCGGAPDVWNDATRALISVVQESDNNDTPDKTSGV